MIFKVRALVGIFLLKASLKVIAIVQMKEQGATDAPTRKNAVSLFG